MSPYQSLLSTLLHYANTRAHSVDRNDFYSLKRRLLQRYGKYVGHDIQEIRKECWGFYQDRKCPGTTCMKCGGTGIYQLKYIHLDRWQWGRYVFHIPGQTLSRLPDPTTVTIVGRIEHPDYGLKASEATLWLYLLCGEWSLLWKALRTSRYCKPRWWPLLNLQAVVMPTAMFLSWKRCWCGRRFPTWGSGWQCCRKCRRAVIYVPSTEIDDPTPF